MNDVKSFPKDVATAWKSSWGMKYFKSHVVLTVLIFVAVIHFSCLYLSIWETRVGVHMIDPLLSRITPRKFSMAIFCIVHSSLLLTLILKLKDPKGLLKAFQAYSLLLLLRTIFIYVLPLEPPVGMIYLQDPITGFFLNTVHVVTKDLFFSGHISAMCLFIYFSDNKIWKTYLKFITPVLAMLILWQHVHYTMDIIAAPFFAFICCKLVDKMNESWEFGIDNIEPDQFEMQRNSKY